MPAATEVQRNGVNTVLTSDAADDSHVAGKSDVETLAIQDEITLMPYQQRSATPRVHGSASEPGSTYWPSAVPLSDSQQYSFRYDS